MQYCRNKVSRFLLDSAGASLVEYAVALVVVTLVGAVIFALGGNIDNAIVLDDFRVGLDVAGHAAQVAIDVQLGDRLVLIAVDS